MAALRLIGTVSATLIQLSLSGPAKTNITDDMYCSAMHPLPALQFHKFGSLVL